MQVPAGPGPHPVAVLLHGNGGNGMGMLNDTSYLPDRILVAPDGYEKSWNIAYEASKAPDVAFVDELLGFLTTHANVDEGDIAMLGISNGSALVNRLLIELDPDTFQHAVTIVSPLNDLQYRMGTFYADPAGDGSYDAPTVPAQGRRVCNVSGDMDGIIPYDGGPGVAGYVFVPAETSSFVWARHMGYGGAQLGEADGEPWPTDPNLVGFSYPGGDVVHYRAIGVGHNAAGEASVREAIAAFLQAAP